MDKDINLLSGIEFENLCQELLEKMGFKTETTKASGDGGIDLVAHNSQPLLSGRYIIQCKRYSGSVGEPIIRDLYGVVTSERANKGILMTTGYFTPSAIKFAEDKNIELIDGEKLELLLSQNDVNLDSYYNSPEYILKEELERTGLSLDEYQFYFGDEEEASDLIVCVKELKKHESLKIRAKIIAILYNRMNNAIINETDFDYSGVALQGARCIEKYAQSILDSNPKDTAGKSIKICTLYIMAVCDIIYGRFSDAILKYDELISYEDLDAYISIFSSANCKLNLLNAITTLLDAMGATDLARKYIKKNRDISENNQFNQPIIIFPFLTDLMGEMKSLEDSVNYNLYNLSVDNKIKVWAYHPYDTEKVIGTEFGMTEGLLQQERRRIEALL